MEQQKYESMKDEWVELAADFVIFIDIGNLVLVLFVEVSTRDFRNSKEGLQNKNINFVPNAATTI